MPHYDAQPGRESPPDSDLSPAQLEADEVDLLRGLNGVAKIVAGATGVSELLSDVAEFALQAIPGVDGAGVTLIDPEHGIAGARVWAATPQFVRDIDDLQYEVLNEGPCVTCMRTHRPTVSGSIGSDERWPHFRGHVARMGVHSVLALPLMIADQVIGAINAYAHKRDAFTEHAVQLGAQFAATCRGVGVQRAAARDGPGAHRPAAAGPELARGHRSGDRHHPQPLRRHARRRRSTGSPS